MPRRTEPDALSLKIGLRIAQFRRELNLTLEELASLCETDSAESLGLSKGHLSNLERGFVRPTATTLKRLADAMGLELVDLVVFPEDSLRQRLIAATRGLTNGSMRKILREIEAAPKKATPKIRAKKVRHRVAKKRT
jgi:transcriptional regulator with XRE-family HTH domain